MQPLTAVAPQSAATTMALPIVVDPSETAPLALFASNASTRNMDSYQTYSVSRYEKIGLIGEGTYGTVYRARDKETNEIVALKKIHMMKEKNGFPLTSLREIRLLKTMKHSNIVLLKNIAVGKKPESVFLVFEYCPQDLATLLDRYSQAAQEYEENLPTPSSSSSSSPSPSPILSSINLGLNVPSNTNNNNSNAFVPFLTEGAIKRLLRSLLSATAYLHSHFVMHRDLKLSNLLLNADGDLKVADFGLARAFTIPLQEYTPRVVTLWYRSPELLLGSAHYHSAIDIWACGCIMGELLTQRPLLPGKSELEQLERICALLGTPNEKIWPALPSVNLQNISLPHYPYNQLRTEFPRLSDNGLDLLNSMLTYDPSKRITASKALQHPYFFEAPLPDSTPLFLSSDAQTPTNNLNIHTNSTNESLTTTITSDSNS